MLTTTNQLKLLIIISFYFCLSTTVYKHKISLLANKSIKKT